MGTLCFPKATRKLQRTLKNLRVSFLCFLLTFLVLRNTIGAGKFGTPAQDFEEIRLHLHNVGLHRRHFRVLAEAVEEENPPSLVSPEDNKQRSALHGGSDAEGAGSQSNVLIPVQEKAEREGLHEIKAPNLSGRDAKAPLSMLAVMQKSASLFTRDVRRHNAPLLAIAKGMAEFRFSQGDEQRKLRKALAHGQPNVLVVLGLQSSGCHKSAGDHLLLKSLRNKVDYSTLHGFEISVGSGDLDPQVSDSISRLSLLQSAMVKYPHVEWLWWVPHQAMVITDMAFMLPLHTYLEFNLVLLGSVGASPYQENLMINLKTDTFLIRNCPWSVELLDKCVKMGSVESIRSGMIIRGPEHAVDDTSVHSMPSNQLGRASRENIHVEESAVLRSHWGDVALKFERSKLHPHTGAGDKRLPFVTDFLGCTVGCEADNEGSICSKQIERILLSVEKQSGLTERLASSKQTVM